MPGFHATVTGRVQGVGFRYFVQRHATRLRIRGFARNLPDGNVEVQAEGAADSLNQLLVELKKGPGMSRVEDVSVIWKQTPEGFEDFSIRY